MMICMRVRVSPETDDYAFTALMGLTIQILVRMFVLQAQTNRSFVWFFFFSIDEPGLEISWIRSVSVFFFWSGKISSVWIKHCSAFWFVYIFKLFCNYVKAKLSDSLAFIAIDLGDSTANLQPLVIKVNKCQTLLVLLSHLFALQVTWMLFDVQGWIAH